MLLQISTVPTASRSRVSVSYKQVLSDDIKVKQVVADKTEKDIDEVRKPANIPLLYASFLLYSLRNVLFFCTPSRGDYLILCQSLGALAVRAGWGLTPDGCG